MAGPADLPTGPASAPTPTSAQVGASPNADCAVSNVVDGDTLDCVDGRRIRLLLIDAPEMYQGALGPVARQLSSCLRPWALCFVSRPTYSSKTSTTGSLHT